MKHEYLQEKQPFTSFSWKGKQLTPQRPRHFGDECAFECECVMVLELGLAAHHVEREIQLNAVFSRIEALW